MDVKVVGDLVAWGDMPAKGNQEPSRRAPANNERRGN